MQKMSLGQQQQQEVASNPAEALRGPQPLDPQQWSQVQGGLPRGGGWISTESAQSDTTQLPRGGGW